MRQRVVALATLAGADSEAEAVGLLPLLPDLASEGSLLLGRLAQWAHALHPGPRRRNDDRGPQEERLSGRAETGTPRATMSASTRLQDFERIRVGRSLFGTPQEIVLPATVLP